ncbi:MAG: hypothetical protein U0228_04410 [Myxococcaceae bacterium]
MGARIIEGLVALFLVWLYFGDLSRFVRAQSAEVVLMNQLPSLPLSLLGVLVAIAFGASYFGRLSGRVSADDRRRALVLFVAGSLVFIDFTILASSHSPISAEARVVAAIDGFTQAANQNSSHVAVPTDLRSLDEWAREQGRPPIFVKGSPVEHWRVELHEGCTGPLVGAPGVPPGTLLYCIAPNHRQAWVTAVANELGHPFGPVSVIAPDGAFVGVVGLAREIPDDEPDERVWERPPPEPTP